MKTPSVMRLRSSKLRPYRLPAWTAALLCLWGTLLWTGCDRPFIDINPPAIEVVSPDLSVVHFGPRLALRLRATSFRAVEQVLLNGEPMSFDASDGTWLDTLFLRNGLNTLLVEAVDEGGIREADTLYAVHAPFSFPKNAPDLPEPLGSHTATLLNDGALLITGGARTLGGPALGGISLLLPGASSFFPLPALLHVPRAGHTATLLPDGRVLILGGARTDAPTAASEFVSEVELYDPATRSTHVVPYSGVPIQRLRHTASVQARDGDYLVDIYGGEGVVRYSNDDVGVRSDLRTFAFRNDSLVSLTTTPFIDDPVSGHTQTSLDPGATGTARRYLVAGSYFTDRSAETVSFLLEFKDPAGLDLADRPAFLVPRTQHVAAQIAAGTVVFHGGRQRAAATALDEIELYIERTRRFYRFPDGVRGEKRFGHTATNLFPGRILLVGGFGPDGNSIARSEFFALDYH